MRNKREDAETEGSSCNDKDADWSGVVTCQGTPGDTRSWKKQ